MLQTPQGINDQTLTCNSYMTTLEELHCTIVHNFIPLVVHARVCNHRVAPIGILGAMRAKVLDLRLSLNFFCLLYKN